MQKKNELSLTSMRQMVLEISNFKVRNLSKMGLCHFISFQPHSHLNMMSQMQSCKTMKKEVQYLRSLLFDLFETLQAVRTQQGNFVSFQCSVLWQPKSK